MRKLFDSHHKIERFGILFGILMVFLIADLALIAKRNVTLDKNSLASTSLYSSSFTTSRTQQSGNILGIYANEEQSRVFILLEWNNINNVSTDATTYQLFLRGSKTNGNHADMKSSPSGILYMFGSTGYMGIYLENTVTDDDGNTVLEAFPSQILYMIVRANDEIVGVTGSLNYADTSFNNYDQFDFYFNPGATNVTAVDFLEKDLEDMDVQTIYEELVIRSQETELKENLNAQLKSMVTDMQQIAEYTNRLTNLGISVSDMVDEIAGDTIVNQDGQIVGTFVYGGTEASVKDTDTLYLATDYIVEGGLDLDWQSRSVTDGWLDDLRGDMTITQYLSSLSSASVTYSTLPRTWYYTDGTEFSYSSDIASSTETTINDTINSLTSAWNTYRSDKVTYQTTMQLNLLKLENEYLSAGGYFTLNDSEGMLYLW